MSIVFLASVLMLILGFSSCEPKKEVRTLRVSLWANQQHDLYKAFQHFKQGVEQRSQGRLKVEVYPSEQLAKEIESIRLIQAGVIDMTVTASLLSNWIEIAKFCELPFMLKDSLDKERLLNGTIGKRVEQEMLDEVGLRALGVFARGPRQLTSNRPIRHPDDLQGLILRVPNVPTFITAWSALGAKPTPMAFSEVFTGLQQGTIQAQENPFSLILNSGFAEVQRYVNLTNHVVSWSYPVIGEKQFQSLPEDLQAIVLEEATEMTAFQKRMFKESEKEVQEKLKARGMQFVEVDQEAFKEKCREELYLSLSPEMQVLYNEFLNELD